LHCFARQRDQQGTGTPFQAHGSVGVKLGCCGGVGGDSVQCLARRLRDWLNSTWKPTMEAMKKAGLIIDYKVFRATPKSPGQPNVILMITYKNGMAALDKGVELEDVAKKVIGSTEVQNKARVFRNEYRKVLGTELIREVILK
jgi:hypothetical protein